MSLYVYPENQTVPYRQAALLNDAIPCNRHYVLHQNGTANLTLLGVVNNPCAMFTRYRVDFEGNIAVPTGGTIGEISVAVAVNGTPISYTIASVVPAAVQNYSHVSGFGFVDVIRGGSPDITILNTSATEDAIDIRNLAVNVRRDA